MVEERGVGAVEIGEQLELGRIGRAGSEALERCRGDAGAAQIAESPQGGRAEARRRRSFPKIGGLLSLRDCARGGLANDRQVGPFGHREPAGGKRAWRSDEPRQFVGEQKVDAEMAGAAKDSRATAPSRGGASAPQRERAAERQRSAARTPPPRLLSRAPL